MAKVKVKQSVAKAITGGSKAPAKKTAPAPAKKKQSSNWAENLSRPSYRQKTME